MQLVEQHIVSIGHQSYAEIDDLCFRSKNLYNSCLYLIKQAYIKDKTNLVYGLYHLMKGTEQYKALPAKVSATVLLMVQKNFKSFFKSIADYSVNPHKYNGRPRLPKYLDSVSGRFLTSYTNQAISKKVFAKANKIKLSGSNIEFRTKITEFSMINCVRIVPKVGHYVIEVVYTVDDALKLPDNGRYYAIDLGVNNLATLTSNVKELTPVIINGKPLKSINQYYNKKLAYYHSQLDKRKQKKSTKNTQKLNLKRKNKIDNYLHKASKHIVGLCKTNGVNTLIIGKNDKWKQDVNIGTRNNQNFVNIPHSRFIEMLNYKCEREGINIIMQEESYTSRASFLDLDHIPIYDAKNTTEHTFSGYRQSRGVYKIKGQKRTINADVNGSYNILRKAIPTAFANGIEGIGVCPKVITLN